MAVLNEMGGEKGAASAVKITAIGSPDKDVDRVAEAIRDQQDVLIVEGFPQIDPETESLAVFAAKTTTKKLQRAQQQATVIGEMMSST